jgi:hypothetical protein
LHGSLPVCGLRWFEFPELSIADHDSNREGAKSVGEIVGVAGVEDRDMRVGVFVNHANNFDKKF